MYTLVKFQLNYDEKIQKKKKFTPHPTLTHYLPPTLRVAAVESQFWFP